MKIWLLVRYTNTVPYPEDAERPYVVWHPYYSKATADFALDTAKAHMPARNFGIVEMLMVDTEDEAVTFAKEIMNQ